MNNYYSDIVEILEIIENGLSYEVAFSLLTGSRTYLELKDVYNEYIKMLASFMTEVGANSPIKVATFYRVLLSMGYLSHNRSNIYRNYNYSFDWDFDILGSTVSTGFTVCRHIASLLADLYKELNVSSYKIICKYIHDEEKIFNLKNKKVEGVNHLVCGVIDQGKKYIVDPTNYTVGVFKTNKLLRHSNIATTNDSKYYILGKKQIACSKEEFKKFERAKVISYGDLNYDDALNCSMQMLIKNYKELNLFYEESKYLLEKMCNLNKIVFPKSDEKIGKILIKREN